MKIQEIIYNICEELNSSPNEQRRRYLEEYLQDILSYQKNNPNQVMVPTSLELYCNEHPEALECRIYDD
jgi:hypothetical protein